MYNKKLLPILFAIIIFTAILAAGCVKTTTIPTGTTTFHVLVTDMSENPLSGAKVVSQSQPEGQLKVDGLTDNDGSVVFNNIKTGDYTFIISRFDYNQVEVAITITPTNNDFTEKMSSSTSTTLTPTTTPISVIFAQLTTAPTTYNGQFVTVKGYYFSGFEISAFAAELVPGTFVPGYATPGQPRIWVTGSLGQSVYDNLFVQNDTPSGYPEHYGLVKVTGLFDYGETYGHMNAYNYQLTVTSAELLPWPTVTN